MKTYNRSLLVVSLFALLLLNACATVAHGRYQAVPVNTSPSGADVSLDCGRGRVIDYGKTPVIVKLKRGADHCIVTLTKEGFEPTQVTFSKNVSGWIWGNLVFGDWIIPTALLDWADGAVYNRYPRAVQFTLARQAETSVSGAR